MTKLLKKFIHDKSGVVAVYFAVIAPLLFAFAVIATEGAWWISEQRKLQTIADLSAFSGAVSYFKEDDEQNARDVVEYISSGSGLTSTDTLTVTFNDDKVTIYIERTLSRYLSEMFDDSPVVVSAQTIAGLTRSEDTSVCMLSLSNDTSPTYLFKGNTEIDLGTCSMWSNSSDSIEVDGNRADVTAGCVASTSTLDDTTFNRLDLDCDQQQLLQMPIENPYAEIQFPDELDYDDHAVECSNRNRGKKNEPCEIELTGWYDGNPLGYFPNGLSLTGDITLQSGIYVVSDKLVFENGANVVGDDVMFYLVDGAELEFKGNATVDLTAIEYGDLENIVIASTDSGKRDVIASLDADLEGVVYLPNRDLKFTGNVDVDGCVQFVVNSIEFAGTASVDMDCNYRTVLPPVTAENIKIILE